MYGGGPLKILIPHLSDDDLFSMGHLLADRSKEPVKTYLNAIVERDRIRAARLVLGLFAVQQQDD